MNPWNSNTIEWTTPVEHIHGNWPGEIPHVHRWPYDYSRPGAAEDFIPQTVKDDDLPEELRKLATKPVPQHASSEAVLPSETLLFGRLLQFLGIRKA